MTGPRGFCVSLAVAVAASSVSIPQPLLAQTVARPAVTTPKPAQIDKNGVLILVRSTLLALDQANKTGNYTVLRDLGSPAFRGNTSAKLSEIFANQRKSGLDLSGVAALEPQLTALPEIMPNGMMHMAGFFPSVPSQIKFEILYEPVQKQWRLFGISVELASSSPIAPSAPESAPSPPPKSGAQPNKASVRQ